MAHRRIEWILAASVLLLAASLLAPRLLQHRRAWTERSFGRVGAAYGPRNLSWSSDGRWMALTESSTSGPEDRLTLLDSASGRVLRFRAARVVNVTWRPCQHEFAYLGGGAVFVARPDSFPGRVAAHGVSSPGYSQGEEYLSWSPEGRRLAAATQRGSVLVLGPDGGGQMAEFPGRLLVLLTAGDLTSRSWSWSPDGRHLLLSCADGHLRAYPVTGGEAKAVPWSGPGTITGVKWSPDGRRVALAVTFEDTGRGANPSGRDDYIAIWDLENPMHLTTFDGRSLWSKPPQQAQYFRIWDIAWSDDGRRLYAIARGQCDARPTAAPWPNISAFAELEAGTGKPTRIQRLPAILLDLPSLSRLAGGQIVSVTKMRSDGLDLWRLGEQRQPLPGGGLVSRILLASGEHGVSTDGRWVLLHSQDVDASWFGKLLGWLALNFPGRSWLPEYTLVPGGRTGRQACATIYRTALLDLKTRRAYSLKGTGLWGSGPEDFKWSPDGSHLAFLCGDRVKVLEFRNRKP